MARFILRGSILRQTLTFGCLLLLAGLQTRSALAQHAPGQFAGAVGGHALAPPPVSRPSLMRPPISRPQVYVAPRFAAFGTGRLLYRTQQPIHLPPPIFPIVGRPLFFGWPFWAFGLGWGYPGYGLGWGLNYCYWMNCSLFWNWQFTPAATPFYEYTPAPPVVSTYIYPFYGEERRDLPQLFLKDGTVYNVVDYWRVDDQLHFTVREPGSPQPSEHVVALDQVDLQKTIDINTAKGFRFVMRDEPMEQYQQDHPSQVPPDWPRPENQ
jgi:hypothetical protein